MLLANLAIGWHEQTRLQPEIAEALSAPFEEPIKLRRSLLRRLLRPHFGLALRLLGELVPGRRTRVKTVLDELDRHAKQVAHEAVTELLMTLSLPGEELSLGSDVPGDVPTRAEDDRQRRPARAARPDRPHTGHHPWQRRPELVEPDRSNQLHRRPVPGPPGRPEAVRQPVYSRGRATKFTRSPLAKISLKRRES